MSSIQQDNKPRRNLSVVDDDLLNSQNRKVFKSFAYAVGIGVGLLILTPILPDIGNEEKSDAMKGLFHSISIAMIAYGLIVAFAFFFLRANISLVLFLLNWVLLPTAGIYFLMDGMEILSK